MVPQTSGSTYADQDNVGGWQEAVTQIKAGAGEHQQLEDRNKAPDITPAERQANAARQGAIGEQLDRNATRFPDNPVVQGAAAGAALSMNQPEKAQIYADRWESLAKPDSPEWAKAVNTGGFAALKTGDFKKSETAARRVLDKFPKDEDALFLYHASKGRGKSGPTIAAPAAALMPAAVPAAAPVVRVPMTDPRVREIEGHLNGSAQALKMGDYELALKQAEKAAGINPNEGHAYMQQALALAALQRLGQALSILDKAIEKFKEGGRTEELPGAYSLSAAYRNQNGEPKKPRKPRARR
ncbi:MAG: hypothetical protein M0D55_09485 [Elusimicrobiota bacterium]|nr:MAG: hypothetical protein M0D55_09485 [Elusimicrobiota bacterium]